MCTISYVCPRLSVFSYIGEDLASSWSLVQYVLRNVQIAYETSHMWEGQGTSRNAQSRRKYALSVAKQITLTLKALILHIQKRYIIISLFNDFLCYVRFSKTKIFQTFKYWKTEGLQTELLPKRATKIETRTKQDRERMCTASECSSVWPWATLNWYMDRSFTIPCGTTIPVAEYSMSVHINQRTSENYCPLNWRPPATHYVRPRNNTPSVTINVHPR